MAKSNYGYIGAGGVAAVQKGLEDMIAARVEAQKLAHQQMIDEGELDVKYGDLDLRRSDQKEKARQWGIEAPSQIQLREQQAIDLMRKPGEAVADHQRRLVEGLAKAQQERELAILKDQQETGRLGVQHGYSMDEIRERGGQQRATNAADPAKKSAGAAGEHLPAAAQTELGHIDTIETLINDITTTGARSGWAGIGGLGYGSGAEFMKKNFGVGSDDAQALRANISNLRGGVSAARAGLTLTPMEKAMLDQYVGDIDSNPGQLQVKLRELSKWAKNRRASLADRFGQPGVMRPAPVASDDGGGSQMLEYVRDASGKLVLKPKG